jgi:hypothetical protein
MLTRAVIPVVEEIGPQDLIALFEILASEEQP